MLRPDIVGSDAAGHFVASSDPGSDGSDYDDAGDGAFEAAGRAAGQDAFQEPEETICAAAIDARPLSSSHVPSAASPRLRLRIETC